MQNRALALLGAGLALAFAQPAAAAVYDWTFTVDALGDGFSGPPTYLNQLLGSGTLTTSDTATLVWNNAFGAPAQAYAVTGITGTLAGAAITGLLPDQTAMQGGLLSSDNELYVIDGQGWDLGPNGNIIATLDRPVDGGNQLAIEGDDFMFGGFVDTVNGNEWQANTGHFTLSPAPTYTGPAVPEPATWVEMLIGFALAGSTLRAVRGARPVTAAA